MSRASAEGLRFKVVGFGLALLFVGAWASQARVQLIAGEEVLKKASASNRYVTARPDLAQRGPILDRNGKVLAQSAERYRLGVNFSKVPQSDAFFVALADAAGLPATELSQAAADGRSGYTYSNSLTPAQARAVGRVKSQWGADGVSLHRGIGRMYPLGWAAANVVGRFGNDDRPVTGLELSQDEALRGQNGLLRGQTDRGGRILPALFVGGRAGEDGQEIVLTLDADLQRAAAAAVRSAVEQHKAESGTAVILDPSTGDILAMASWPSFDEFDPKPGADLNPATMAPLEPGSTFKILTLAKALDEGKASLNVPIVHNGTLEVGGHTIKNGVYHGSRVAGSVLPEEAIARSCNVSAATWAMRIGYDGMVQYLDDLGVLAKPGLGLPKESAGLFNRDEYAKTLQIANVGFGQALNATPVMLASAFGMLGNDGVRMRPRLVMSVGGEETPVVEECQVVRPGTAREVLRVMESVIDGERGTGKAARIPGYSLGGKTGTAQKLGSAKGGYVANFVGFVPAQRPKAVILVMIDHPTAGEYYGGSVAAPVFRELAQQVIRRFAIPPDQPVEPNGGEGDEA